MLLEAMVGINDERFAVAEDWISETRELRVPDSMVERYERELQEARNAKAARDSDNLGAIFASATPAAILAEPEVSFDTPAGDASAAGVDGQAASASEPTALAMVLPGAAPEQPGETAELPADDPEPELLPISQLEFRRFVEPKRPTGIAARNKEGWVELQFWVDEKGKTVDVEITDAQPDRIFDQAALSAIRKWRFEPYRVDGKPTTTKTGVRLRFEK